MFNFEKRNHIIISQSVKKPVLFLLFY